MKISLKLIPVIGLLALVLLALNATSTRAQSGAYWSRIDLGFPHDFLTGSTFLAMFGGAAVESR